MSDQWTDWRDIIHICCPGRSYTVCWINITSSIDRDAQQPPTCLRCVAWRERSLLRGLDMEKQGRASS